MVAATDQYITLEVTDFDPNDIIWNGEMTYTAILATPDWQCPNHGPMDPYSTATITFGGEKTPYCHYCVFETALEVLKEHGLTPLEPYRKPIDNRK